MKDDLRKVGRKPPSDNSFYEGMRLACRSSDGEAVASLLASRAGRPVDPEQLWPAMHCASIQGSAMACLVQLAPLATAQQASKGLCLACSEAQFIEMEDRLKICRVLEPLCDPHALGDRRMTPLMAAARAGFVEIVNALIPRSEIDRRCMPEPADADPAECARHGATAMRLAAAGGGPRREGCVRALLRAGADARVADMSGRTPLMGANATWEPSTLRDLILASDPCAVDGKGESALPHFLDRGHAAGVRMLIAMADEGQGRMHLEQIDAFIASMTGGKSAGPLAMEAKGALEAHLESKAIAAVLDRTGANPAARRRI